MRLPKHRRIAQYDVVVERFRQGISSYCGILLTAKGFISPMLLPLQQTGGRIHANAARSTTSGSPANT